MTEHPRPFDDNQALDPRSTRLRITILRTHAVAGQGHLGSSLSLVEILSALFAEGRFATNVTAEGDRLVLSKGHAALGLYCALAEAGIISHATLATFGQNGSTLEPHPNETVLPEGSVCTGSLGQGLSIGLGFAYASRLSGRSDERTVVILGDGELNEGQPWEAAIAARRLKLGTLLAIVDANGMQQDGAMSDIMPIDDLQGAWAALGWQVHTVDGHDFRGLLSLLAEIRDVCPDTPKLIVAQTVKGRGVPFLENAVDSHYPSPLDNAELDLIERLLIAEMRDVQ
ncbi:transketolase [Bradyrhizobium pachyrhizi]|uniref:transketolase n=1 Tax=Bradyrhizobium pachyrhizi TaxID=280333 RepID=UPI00067B677C|nr:transketolase [Bradyrhizobium pachyrhizi]